MNIKTKPFSVPNFCLEDKEFPLERRGFHLSEMDPEELSAKCDEFRAGVFAKAGKKDPRANP